jgi:aconitate hydratase
MFLGVKAVVAVSIERIHRANLINFGIAPFTFANAADYQRVDNGDRVEVRGAPAAVRGGTAELRLVGKGYSLPLRLEISDRERDILLAGGLLNTVTTARVGTG